MAWQSHLKIAGRDQRLRSLTWKGAQDSRVGLQQAKSDHSIWRIREVGSDGFKGPTRGLLGVYVDDLLLTAEAELVEGLLDAVTTTWKCSSPQSLEQKWYFVACNYRHKERCICSPS